MVTPPIVTSRAQPRVARSPHPRGTTTRPSSRCDCLLPASLGLAYRAQPVPPTLRDHPASRLPGLNGWIKGVPSPTHPCSIRSHHSSCPWYSPNVHLYRQARCRRLCYWRLRTTLAFLAFQLRRQGTPCRSSGLDNRRTFVQVGHNPHANRSEATERRRH